MRQLTRALLTAAFLLAALFATSTGLQTAHADCIVTDTDTSTGLAYCREPSGPSSGGKAPSQSQYQAPTLADAQDAIPNNAELGRDIATAPEGALTCVPAAGGGVQVWNGERYVDGGDACPLNGVVTQETPARAAQIAIARLEFTAAAPAAGPNHTINKLPFDVPVGYPVWLWTEGGDTDTRTVTDKAGGRTVRLTVAFDHTSWTLGDGTTLDCATTTPWTTNVATAAESPTCGHTYDKPGDYTITATSHWTITWNVAGQTGIQDTAISRSIPFEVGELQVLVR